MEYIGKLIEFFQRLLVWWVIVVPWERGIRIRGGKHSKSLGAGCHFRIPFYDQIYVQTIRLRVLQLSPQTVTTSDGKTLTIVAAVGYSVKSIEKVYETLYQPEMTLSNMVMGHMAEYITTTAIAQCEPVKIEAYCLALLKDSDFGIDFEYMKIIGFAVVRTFRLINDGHWTPNELNTTLAK